MCFMNLETFLKLEKPEEYDFKLLMYEYYEKYKEKHDGDKKYQKMLDELPKIAEAQDPIERWYLYKTLDQEYRPEKYRFDCDSWNDTCDLTTEIYQTLWWDKKIPWANSITSRNFSGDTMNSFATIFNAYAERTSFKDSYTSYNTELEFREKVRNILGEYVSRVSWIGNFILVPHNYSGSRGRSKELKDYWDLSLNNLLTNGDEQNWLSHTNLTFRKYINTFFLWDYVSKGYRVLPLFPSHQALLTPWKMIHPRREGAKEGINEFKLFTTNVNSRILRRGIFMMAMLKIATDSKCKDDYVSKIVPALSTSAYLGSMENVVRRLTSIPELSEATKSILEKINLPDIPNAEE